MAIRMATLAHAKRMLRRPLSTAKHVISTATDVPRGRIAVYVGEGKKKRFLIPISYLNQPTFRDLLSQAEDEFGFHHPMGGLTIPCREDTFFDLISQST